MGVTVRVLQDEKVHGIRMPKGHIMEIPDCFVADLAARGVVEVLQKQKLTSMLGRQIPPGVRVLLKNDW